MEWDSQRGEEDEDSVELNESEKVWSCRIRITRVYIVWRQIEKKGLRYVGPLPDLGKKR